MLAEKTSIQSSNNNTRMASVILFFMTVSIILGYVSTRSFFENYELTYAIYTLICICGSLLFSLSCYSKKIKKIYLVFGVMFYVSYILKFYLILYFTYFNDTVVYRLALYSPRILKYIDEVNMIDVYSLSSIAFFLFSILTIIHTNPKNKPKEIYFESVRIATKSDMAIMLFIALVLFSVFSFARLILGAYNQASYFIVLSTYFLPLVFIFILNASIVSGYIKLSKVISYSFIFVGIVQFILFTSKVYILLPVVWVVLIQVIHNVELINKKILVLFSIPVIVLYPMFNIYREVVSEGGSQIIFSVFDRFVNSQGNYFVTGALSVLFRFVGAESLIVLMAEKSYAFSNYGFFSVLTQEKSITQILTYDILGYDFIMGVAPTLLGQIYFITGSVIVTSVMLTLYFYIVTNVFAKLTKQRSIFSKTLSLYIIVYAFIFYNEGILWSNMKYQIFGLMIFVFFYIVFT